MPTDTIKAPKKPVHIPENPRLALLRLPQVLSLISVSPSCWWQGIKDGRFPPGWKLSERIHVWPGNQIMDIVEGRKP
jgi:prophage regulatory protein